MNVDFLFLLAQQQQAGGGGPQFVGAAPATQIAANGSAVSINVGTAISGIQNGDYVIAVWASDAREGQDVVFNTGTGLVGEPPSLPLSTETVQEPGHFVKGWTYASSTPSLSITNPSSTVTLNGVLLLAAFRDVQAPVSANVARVNGSSGNPDAPSLSGVQNGSIVLAIGLLDDDGVSFSSPNEFTTATQGTSAAIGTGFNASAIIAYQTSTASGAVNPGAFTSSGSDEWYAYTIELRAAQAGGGNTWTMTAGASAASGQPGYNMSLPVGSISNEPVAGLSLRFQVSSLTSVLAFSFDGDQVSALSGFTELVVDGTVFGISSWNFASGVTGAVWSGSPPAYVDGVTYNCELR